MKLLPYLTLLQGKGCGYLLCMVGGGVRTITNVITPPSPQGLGPPGCYTEAL